jgi:hypothetical protein
MLSPTAAWKAAFDRADVSPVVLATISFPSAVTYKVTKGYSDDATVRSYPNSLESISPVNGNVDVLDRKCKVNSVSLRFLADGWMKNLSINNFLRGRKVNLKIGARELAEADYLNWFTGVIDEQPIPKANGAVELKCASAFSILRDREIVAFWGPMHPLEAITRVLTLAGIPTDLYDSTSLDPSQSVYDSIGHFVIQRGAAGDDRFADNAVRSPTSALKLVEELCMLLDGGFVEREDGKLTFKIFDKTAATSYDLTHNDIDHESFEVLEQDKNMVNRVTVTFAKIGGDYLRKYTDNDTASQAAHEYSDGTDRILSRDYQSNWLDNFGIPNTAFSSASVPGSGDNIRVGGANMFGMCGTRLPSFPGSTTQPAWAQVSDSKPAYLMIDNEVIRCDLTTYVTGSSASGDPVDPLTGTRTPADYPGAFDFRIDTGGRGTKDTTAVAHTGSGYNSYIYDVTIPVYLSDRKNDRFSNGVPIIKVKVPLRRFDLQLLDLVSLTTDKYFTKGTTSLDTDTKWEIIGKEMSVDGGDVGIVLTLAWATHVTPPARITTNEAVEVAVNNFALNAAVATHTEAVVKKSVTGFEATNGGGLVLNIAAGKIGSGISYINKVAKTFTLVASKDNYIYIDFDKGTWFTKTTTVAAGEPTREHNLVSICRARTDGSSITLITDMRNQETVKGTSLVSQTVAVRTVAQATNLSVSVNTNAYFQSATRIQYP